MNEFVSSEVRTFTFKIGRYIASSLSGFIAGVIFASIFWITLVYLWSYLR